jgi:hypothetical protein
MANLTLPFTDVKFVDILGNNLGITELWAGHGNPLRYFVIDIVVMSGPVQPFYSL